MAPGAGLWPPLIVAGGFIIGDVDGHHRSHFGATVAFEQRNAELFAEGGGDGITQLVGAHQHVAQAGELLGCKLARVGGAEGGGGDQQRALVPVLVARQP
jgi:hypothetical protein